MKIKQKLFASFTFILLVLIVVVISILLNKEKDQMPTQQDTNPFELLQPGVSDKDDAIRELGQPVSETDSKLEFRSNSETRNNIVTISDDTITKIVQNVTLPENITVQDMKTKYGEPPNVLYGNESVIGFYLYVHPEQGVAYLGHSFDGTILEIWYFIPSDYETFKGNYAEDFSEELEDHNHGHELE